jgi:diguanylate cyclase (GGDEF)-like protein/PAS domain S-box-containing protein
VGDAAELSGGGVAADGAEEDRTGPGTRQSVTPEVAVTVAVRGVWCTSPISPTWSGALGLLNRRVTPSLSWSTARVPSTAYEAVRQRERLFHRLAESLPDGLFLVDDDKEIVYANARLGSILGVRDAPDLTRQLASVVPDDRARLVAALEAAVHDRRDRQVEIEVLVPDSGLLRWCLATVTALSDEEGLSGAMVTLSDVTESAILREELRHQATHDSLTGCFNQASTLAALRRILDDEQGRPATVLFVDLDHFKTINDTFGHSVGDRFLADSARRIAALARGDDVVGRIGGDEFLMICHGISTAPEALEVAERLQQTLTRSTSVAGRIVHLSASIVVTIATPGSSVHAVVTRADEAMYSSKRQPRRKPVFLAGQDTAATLRQ